MTLSLGNRGRCSFNTQEPNWSSTIRTTSLGAVDACDGGSVAAGGLSGLSVACGWVVAQAGTTATDAASM